MSNPFISICIPTYKNVDYLQRLLQSIIKQTFTDYEIVITDNSPDNSVEHLVIEFNNQLSIRYYRNDPPTNMGENFNRVIRKASGVWIKMMHDDDWFASPDSLKKFSDATLNSSKSFIFSAYKDVHAHSGKEVNEFFEPSKKVLLDENPLNLFSLNVIGHPSTVMHKKDTAILYDPQFKWVVDIDFYIRYLQKYPGYEYIPEMLVNIGIDENQLSAQFYKNPKVEIPEYFKMLYKHGIKITDHKYVFHAFWMIVRKFKIKNVGDIKASGYSGQIPDAILQIINFQKNIPGIILKQTPFSNHFMKKCLLQCRETHSYNQVQ
ncbi:MAG: glycosyltransferase [Chitinophagaceae bacterium]